MPEELSMVLSPETAYDEAALRRQIEKKTGRSDFSFRIIRRSVDARKPDIKVNITVQL
ncbi:MAG: FAD-binding protein, partial [Bacteroidetes bacterium]